MEKQAFSPWTAVVTTAILTTLLLVALGGAVFWFIEARHADATPASSTSSESDRVVEGLKRVLLITETDQPSVARIDNPDALRASNPEFYADAKAGDYLIAYPKRAIIYRESDNMIVNFAVIVPQN